MKRYEPLPVLPDLTDEALNSPRSIYKDKVRELLLTIPAEYRQAACAEDDARTYEYVRGSGGTEKRAVRPHQLDTVVAEIRIQLNRSATP